MHIKPGTIVTAKIGQPLFSQPRILRTLLAAVFFLLLMQSVHLSAGSSALYVVGAMPIYLLLGFIPALLGAVLGLLIQGTLLGANNLPQLALSGLSLLLPLIAVHFTLGRKLSNLTNGHHLCWRSLLKLDAMYYVGVTGIAGVWLLMTQATLPFTAWGMFAATCFAIAALESAFIYSMLRIRKLHQRAARAHFVSPLRRAQLGASSL